MITLLSVLSTSKEIHKEVRKWGCSFKIMAGEMKITSQLERNSDVIQRKRDSSDPFTFTFFLFFKTLVVISFPEHDVAVSSFLAGRPMAVVQIWEVGDEDSTVNTCLYGRQEPPRRSLHCVWLGKYNGRCWYWCVGRRHTTCDDMRCTTDDRDARCRVTQRWCCHWSLRRGARAQVTHTGVS